MKYNLILFDLDDTLLDFHGAQEVSLKNILQLECDLRFADVLKDFREINHQLWGRFERGQISKNEVVVSRFQHLVDRHKIEAQPENLNEQFLRELSNLALVIDGAKQLCSELSEKVTVGIITNGVSHVQHSRLQRSGLVDHFDFVCVSEDCGYSKPQAEIFHHALKLSGLSDSEAKTLVVGDRLDVDVLGAHNAGMDSCWYNPKRLAPTHPIQPRYEISHLSELSRVII